MSSESRWVPAGSRFARRVALNSTGSCGIVATASRTAFSGNVWMSTASISQLPAEGSTNRNSTAGRTARQQL